MDSEGVGGVNYLIKRRMNLSKEEIKRIISEEIEVDANGDDEIVLGWETYMIECISYPFEAECKIRRSGPVNTWEKVEVIGENSNYSHAPKVYCVDVVFNNFIFTVRLEDLR
ncbi:MAG: hypothetical protein ACI85O_001291, partial [Saprospiraceae bacterium]